MVPDCIGNVVAVIIDRGFPNGADDRSLNHEDLGLDLDATIPRMWGSSVPFDVVERERHPATRRADVWKLHFAEPLFVIDSMRRRQDKRVREVRCIEDVHYYTVVAERWRAHTDNETCPLIHVSRHGDYLANLILENSLADCHVYNVFNWCVVADRVEASLKEMNVVVDQRNYYL